MSYPQVLTLDEVEQYVADAYQALPLPVVAAIEREGYQVVIEDGEPPEEDTMGECWVSLRTIKIYAQNFIRRSWCWREEEARARLAVALRHEVAHALGMSHAAMADPSMHLFFEHLPALQGHTEK
jgi:predicted Zn-dependent protease with MMP-like domain